MLKTLVEQRTGERSGVPAEFKQRVADEFAQAQTLPSDDDVWRIAIPVGRTGLQQIVVDLRLTRVAGADPPMTTIRLLAFGKEGLLSRKPTAKTADRVWAALAS